MRAAVVASLALVLVPLAPAATARDALIRPGVSIGEVRLGMTAGELRRALGKPWTQIVDEGGFGRRTLDLQYALLDVRLTGVRGRERVVVIESRREGERTKAGIGPGVPETRLLAQRGVRCNPFRPTSVHDTDGYDRIGGARACFLDGPGGARTIFVSIGPRLRIEGPGETFTRAEFERRWKREARVAGVIVRAAGQKLEYED